MNPLVCGVSLGTRPKLKFDKIFAWCAGRFTFNLGQMLTGVVFC